MVERIIKEVFDTGPTTPRPTVYFKKFCMTQVVNRLMLFVAPSTMVVLSVASLCEPQRGYLLNVQCSVSVSIFFALKKWA